MIDDDSRALVQAVRGLESGNRTEPLENLATQD